MNFNFTWLAPRYRISAWSLLLVFAVIGCGRQSHPQEGQIFIATQGGQNLKLGAVEILAFDEATITAFTKRRRTEITQLGVKLQEDVDRFQDEFKKLKRLITER